MDDQAVYFADDARVGGGGSSEPMYALAWGVRRVVHPHDTNIKIERKK